MNNERRKTLSTVTTDLKAAMDKLEGYLKEVSNAISEAKSDLDTVQEGEQEAFDNMSENLQGGEKGQRMEEVASNLSEVSSDLDTIISEIDDWDLPGRVTDLVGKIEECME